MRTYAGANAMPSTSSPSQIQVLPCPADAKETTAGAEVQQPCVAIDHDRIYGAQVTKGNRAATCGCV